MANDFVFREHDTAHGLVLGGCCMTNKDDNAYPMAHSGELCIHDGLSKRELFAAMALQGLVGNSSLDTTTKEDAIAAVKAADALIDELNKNKGEE